MKHLLLALLMLPTVAQGVVYYVDDDSVNGTFTNCNGRSPLPYDGDGTGENCAWASPLEAVGPRFGNGSYSGARIGSGDILYIAKGTYYMGKGGDITCASNFGCHLYDVPDGTALNYTRIRGQGWSRGCSAADRPTITVNQGDATDTLDALIDLGPDANYIKINCLELTDPVDAVLGGAPAFPSGSESFRCGSASSYDCGQNGIYWGDGSNIEIRQVYIHGLATTAIEGKGYTENLLVEDFELIGNGKGGIGLDDGLTTGIVDVGGTLTLRRGKINWSGCTDPSVGTYTGAYGQEPNFCCAGTLQCFGDAFGMGIGRAEVLMEDLEVNYNTSDGIDLLYQCRDQNDAQGGATLPEVDPCNDSTLRRISARGNAGSFIKTRGGTTIEDSEGSGDCQFHRDRAQNGAGYPGMDYAAEECRGGGARLSVNTENGTVSIDNSSFSSESVSLASLFGDTGVTVNVRNSVFFANWNSHLGDTFVRFLADGINLSDINFTNSYANGLGSTGAVALDCSGTAGLTCGAAVNLTDTGVGSIDFTPDTGSVLIDASTSYGGSGYDVTLIPRPSGDEDVGARESSGTAVDKPETPSVN